MILRLDKLEMLFILEEEMEIDGGKLLFPTIYPPIYPPIFRPIFPIKII